MADTLTTITKLINSPPGQLAAGGALAGIVWKFFERVEAVLTDDTKLEIAVWLLGVKTANTLSRWPETLRLQFDAVFANTPVSWRGPLHTFYLSGITYGLLFFIVQLTSGVKQPSRIEAHKVVQGLLGVRSMIAGILGGVTGLLPRWRRDEKELYYLSRDLKLMAASVKATVGAKLTFETGVTRRNCPDGLTPNAAGRITGTLTNSTTFSFTGKVMDSAGAFGTANCSISIAPPTCTYTLSYSLDLAAGVRSARQPRVLNLRYVCGEWRASL